MGEDQKDKTPTPDVGKGAAEEQLTSLERPQLPGELPVLPTGANVIFPGMMVPLVFSSERSMRCVDDTVVKDRRDTVHGCEVVNGKHAG